MSLLCTLFFFGMAIFADVKWYAILLGLIWAAVFVWVMLKYREYIKYPVQIARTTVLSTEYDTHYKSRYSDRAYMATVLQEESKTIVENVRISHSTYTFCSEGNILYIIKYKNEFVGINGYDY